LGLVSVVLFGGALVRAHAAVNRRAEALLSRQWRSPAAIRGGWRPWLP
jgi:hypothetical protein